MGTFIYYDNIEDYEKQVKKVKLYNKKSKEVKELKKQIEELNKKINEYFRTPDGKIGKITDIPKHSVYFDDGFSIEHEFIECGRDIMKELESKPDITDIVAVGDLMFIDISPDDCGGIVVPRIAETEYDLERFKEKFKSGEYVLRGIVPKEKINNMIYWVGGK